MGRGQGDGSGTRRGMTEQHAADSARFSRDGDQFHYLWAARQCLELLSFSSDVVAVTIEGASKDEQKTGHVEAGDQVIDVGQYYASEAWDKARLVRYTQLKHSTVRSAQPWTLSGLKPTLAAFASRYLEMRAKAADAELAGRLKFDIVTNRPISPELRQLVAAVAAGTLPATSNEVKSLAKACGLRLVDLRGFCSLVSLKGDQANFIEQRSLLQQGVAGFLSAPDHDAILRLKDLVARKAGGGRRRRRLR